MQRCSLFLQGLRCTSGPCPEPWPSSQASSDGLPRPPARQQGGRVRFRRLLLRLSAFGLVKLCLHFVPAKALAISSLWLNSVPARVMLAVNGVHSDRIHLRPRGDAFCQSSFPFASLHALLMHQKSVCNSCSRPATIPYAYSNRLTFEGLHIAVILLVHPACSWAVCRGLALLDALLSNSCAPPALLLCFSPFKWLRKHCTFNA